MNKQKRPVPVWLIFIFLLVVGLGALISGPMLFIAPDGHLMMWSTEMLDGSPFPDYLIPGIILFLFLGLFPVITAYGLVKRPNLKLLTALNPSKHYHWAWAASWAAGIIMLIWISVETMLLGYLSFLQPVIAISGILVVGLAGLPDVRRHFAVASTREI